MANTGNFLGGSRRNYQRKTEKQMLGDLEQEKEFAIREQETLIVLQNVLNKIVEAKRQTENSPGRLDQATIATTHDIYSHAPPGM